MGEHIRKTRLFRGHRQRDLALVIGVHSRTVANWERSRCHPLARHHAAIIVYLGTDPEPTPISISGRLRTVRRRLGLTQAQLAVKVGLDEGSICRWESGRRRPSGWMAVRLAGLLDAIDSGGIVPHTWGLHFFDLTRWLRRPPPDLLGIKPVTLGERIRLVRITRGMSQLEAARLFGVTHATLYRWESGAEPVPKSRMQAIQRFLRPEGS